MRKAVRAIVVKENKLLVMHRNKFGHESYALVGGGIDFGETAEQALHRELHEEASISVGESRLVIIEETGSLFGTQYIYFCNYISGEPELAPDSEEAKITALGQNIYTPMWLPLDQLPEINLLPSQLKDAVIVGLRDGFGETPVTLTLDD